MPKHLTHNRLLLNESSLFFTSLVTLGNLIILFAAFGGFTKLKMLILLFAVSVMREIGH